MAKQAQVKLNYDTVENPETDLPADTFKLYETYRKAMQAMLKARNAFEASAYNAIKNSPDGIPAGKDVSFGYNFGKLAVAFCDLGDARGFATKNRGKSKSAASPSNARKLFGK